MESHEVHAQLSDAAYGKTQPPEGWQIDPELSNRNRTVFYHPESDQAVLSLRGTDLKNSGDLGTDLLLSLGLQNLSARFKNAHKTAKHAAAKYNNLTLVGHSLGGSTALHVQSKMPHLPAVTFAPYVSPTNELRKQFNQRIGELFGYKVPSKKATIHVTKPDLISSFAWMANANHVVHPQKKGYHAHSIHNFY
jgi:hypothetical protein